MHNTCSHTDHIKLGPRQETEDEILERAKALSKMIDAAINKLELVAQQMGVEGAD